MITRVSCCASFPERSTQPTRGCDGYVVTSLGTADGQTARSARWLKGVDRVARDSDATLEVDRANVGRAPTRTGRGAGCDVRLEHRHVENQVIVDHEEPVQFA